MESRSPGDHLLDQAREIQENLSSILTRERKDALVARDPKMLALVEKRIERSAPIVERCLPVTRVLSIADRSLTLAEVKAGEEE